MGLEFFTSTRWSPPDGLFGALPFIWGTLYTAAIAVVLAVPVSLGVALFITQVAPPWLKKPLVYLLDLLAVVPSVVFGLWGVLVLSQHFGLGRSFLTAGVILAVMIIPIITSLAREVIETTPAGGEGGGARARRDPLGDDPRRGLAAQQGRARRCGDARAWAARWARRSPRRS